jgi:hypothetical protein
MATGQRYTTTWLYVAPLMPSATALSPGPAPIANLLELDLRSLSPNFVADPTGIHIAQNADGTWAGQMTGVYKGGTVADTRGHWTLLQIVAA